MKKYLIITTMFAIFFGFAAANTSKAANSPFASLLKKPISGTISKTIKPISGTIRGLIRRTDGKPVTDTYVHVYRKVNGTFEFYAEVKADGGPKGGRYTVKIDKQGVYDVVPSSLSATFTPRRAIVKVLNKQPVTVDFRMRVAK